MDGGGRDDQTALRRRMAAFAGMSLELGWLTLDRFLTAGTDMGSVPGPLRDDAMAEAAGYVIDACADPSVQLRSHSSPPSAGAGAASVPAEDVEVEGGAPQRLVQAAADLFAEKGPVATSTRELAERAGVGQRVIYRHFVSKEALLSEALDAVWSPAYLAALAPEGLDLDLVVALVRQRSTRRADHCSRHGRWR